jgi:hypothetical protein
MGQRPITRLRCVGALPNLIVIGAMKCGTTALHRYLDSHPQIAMTDWKELNFFIGDDEPPHDREEDWWQTGQWHRGVEWYASQFDAQTPVRGESSPGYTSPDHAHAAASRIGEVVPDVRLLYVVRDPVQRAVSQYRHHRRDGTERRPVADALLDPGSQYLSRSRYVERLGPFLDRFPRDQLHIIVQERLSADPRRELERVYAHVGADPAWAQNLSARRHGGVRSGSAPAHLVAAMRERLGDDVSRLRRLMGDDLPEWSL